MELKLRCNYKESNDELKQVEEKIKVQMLFVLIVKKVLV